MNRQRMLALADYLDTTRAKKFDPAAYYIVTKDGRQMCYFQNVPHRIEEIKSGNLAGIVVILFREEAGEPEGKYEHIKDTAARILDLDTRQAFLLLEGSWHPQPEKITMHEFAVQLREAVKADELRSAKAMLKGRNTKPQLEDAK